jgi:hypothetical protein
VRCHMLEDEEAGKALEIGFEVHVWPFRNHDLKLIRYRVNDISILSSGAPWEQNRAN